MDNILRVVWYSRSLRYKKFEEEAQKRRLNRERVNVIEHLLHEKGLAKIILEYL